MDLVVHHMFESLIVGRAEEYLSVYLPAVEAAIHDFVAPRVVAEVAQNTGDLLYITCVVKRGRVTFLAFVSTDFAL